MEQPIIVNFINFNLSYWSKNIILYNKELSCCLDDIIEKLKDHDHDTDLDIPQEKLSPSLIFLESMFGSINLIAYRNIVIRRRNTKLLTITWCMSSLTPTFLDTLKEQTQIYTLK